MFLARTPFLLATCVLCCGACAQILGFEEGQLSGSGGAGCISSECTSGDKECATPLCNPDDTCGLEVVSKGTECTGGVCNGDGYCVAPSCLDGKLSAGETDIDCGGDMCVPCEGGNACKVEGDCKTGFCADDVCCESACDTTCAACVESKTGKPDGKCEPVPPGTDPNGGCGFASLCDANGVCQSMHKWSMRFGEAAGDRGLSVALDAAGDASVTGHFTGTIDLGGGPLVSAGLVLILSIRPPECARALRAA